jgi:hypothetical protein
MNLSYKYIILPLLSVLFLNSCEKVIEFNGIVTDPLVVVNSIVTPDLVVSAQVSMSRFFLSDSTTYNFVSNATVSLIVNGKQKENLKYTSKGTYVGTYKPVIGDSIQMLVQTPGENNVSCGTVIEPKSNIPSQSPVDTSRVLNGTITPIVSVTAPANGNPGSIDTIGYAIGRTLKFVLKFTDNPAVQNYYRLVLQTRTYTSATAYSSDYNFSFDDIVAGDTKDAVGAPTSLISNKYNVFTDDLFNEKQYPLSFSIPDNINVYYPGYAKAKPKKEVYINLQSISKSYYLYLQTRAAIKINTFFAEPVQVFSNVDGGIGIMGSYTSNIIKVVL